MSKFRDQSIDKDRETRYTVLTREQYRCFICERTNVEVHEVIPRSRFGLTGIDVLFDVKNRVALCREHHSEAHTRAYRIFLLSLLKEKFDYDYSMHPFANYMEDLDG